MSFGMNAVQTFNYAALGCELKIRIKRDYALSGKSCTYTDVIAGRTSFVIPPPIPTASGCTAPSL